MDPDAAETLWLAKWGEHTPTTTEVIVAQAPWSEIANVLHDNGRLEQYQPPRRYLFVWKLKEKHNE